MLTVTCGKCNKTDFNPNDACKACGEPFDNATLARIASAAMKEGRRATASAATHAPSKHIILTTTPDVPGQAAVAALGIVTAEVVLGTNIFRDMLASVSDVFGGRSGTYQSALRNAKRQAQHELRAEAKALGADAVVGVDLDYSEISGDGKSMLMLVISGTAVKLAAPKGTPETI